MDHVVYLDKKAKEFEKIKNNEKSMIIRGAAGRKMPYGRVHEGDILYFMNNDASGVVIGKAAVHHVFNSEKMSKEESAALVDENMEKLNLSKPQIKRWAGKRYLVLIEIKDFEEVDSFGIDRSEFGNMDDWLPVEEIDKYKT